MIISSNGLHFFTLIHLLHLLFCKLAHLIYISILVWQVIYVEACESGSMFQGMMPKDLNIYVTTASNAVESSWGTYCPGMQPPPPPEFLTCLGDLYSIAWMEDRFPLFYFLLYILVF